VRDCGAGVLQSEWMGVVPKRAGIGERRQQIARVIDVLLCGIRRRQIDRLDAAPLSFFEGEREAVRSEVARKSS
jgi:hypothetical protein